MSYYPGQYPQHPPPPQQGYPQPYPNHPPPPQQQYYQQQPYQQPPPPQQYPQQQQYPHHASPHPQPYPGPSQYGAPPPGQYGPPPGGYGPPPSIPPHPNHQPQQQPAPYGGQYAPPPQQYGAPPPVLPSPSFGGGAPAYAPAPAQVQGDVEAIYKACKGFGTDERTLIRVLANRDGPTIDAIRRQYHVRGDLVRTLEKETSGDFELVLVATALGPVESEAFWAQRAIKGLGTKESMLTEAVMGRSNAELAALKHAYRSKYRNTLESDVKGDLSMKTETLFVLAMQGRKPDEWVQPDPNQARSDASAVYMATKAKLGTDERTVCEIFTRCNDNQLRALSYEYERSHGQGSLVKAIRGEFSGHMKDALLYILEGATDKAKRDAVLLEDSMKGLGTKDELLISRVVRAHWDRPHMERVKQAYQSLYRRSLAERIRGETSGYYRDMLLEMVK